MNSSKTLRERESISWNEYKNWMKPYPAKGIQDIFYWENKIKEWYFDSNTNDCNYFPNDDLTRKQNINKIP